MESPKSSDPRSPRSLPELKGRHLQLLKDWQDLKDARRVTAARQLREEAAALGRWLEDPADRDEAQGVIDYWSSLLGGLPDQSFPELLRLTDFEPAAATEIETVTEAVFDDLGSEDRERVARWLILGAVTGEALKLGPPPADPETLAAVEERLIDAGILVRRSGGGVVIAHEKLLRRCWPRLEAWLAAARLDAAEYTQLVTAAALWSRSRRPSDLLRPAALRHAIRRRDDDAAIAAFIQASIRQSVIRWSLISITAIAALGAATLVYWLSQEKEDQLKKSLKKSQASAAGRAVDYRQNTSQYASAGSGDLVEPESDAGTSEAAVWVGDASQPLFKDETGRKTVPSQMKAGEIYRAGPSIWLRTDYPDPTTYQSAGSVGILPSGGWVIATSDAKGFDRPSGVQYWLRVRPLPGVFIQYDGAGRDEATLLAQRLIALKRYGVSPVDQEKSAAGKAEVRYFREDDEDRAQQLAQDVRASVASRPTVISKRVPGDWPTIPPGQLEVWIDLNKFPLQESASSERRHP